MTLRPTTRDRSRSHRGARRARAWCASCRRHPPRARPTSKEVFPTPGTIVSDSCLRSKQPNCSRSVGSSRSAGPFRDAETCRPGAGAQQTATRSVDNTRVRNTSVPVSSRTARKAKGTPAKARTDPAARDSGSRARTFGETLRKTRRKTGVSQDDLAHISGVDRSAISNYERGQREPNLRTIVRLARALEVHPTTLLRDL